MGKRVVIRFPADRPYAYYTRVFHFAEALWDPIVSAGLGTLGDIDHARETIGVDVVAARHVGEVKQIVKKALARHRLLDDATITSE